MEARRWHSSYPSGIPLEIDVDAQATLGSMIVRAVASFAMRPAVTCLEESLSYAELGILSEALATFLQQSGLRKGDRVALMLPSCPAFLIGLAAIFQAGMVAVPVNPLYTPRELKHQLQDSDATCIIVADQLQQPLQQVLEETSIVQVLTAPVVGMKPIVGQLVALAKHAGEVQQAGTAGGGRTCQPLVDAILQGGRGGSLSPVAQTTEDIAILQYTGGTTGVSKGAVLTHKSVCASLAQILTWVGPTLAGSEASMVTPLPLYHIFPLATALLALSLGCENRLVPNPREAGSVLAELKRRPFQMLVGVNTLFNSLVNTPELISVDFSATRLVIGAGASIQDAIAKRWLAAGAPPVTEAYGLTETSPSATFNPPGRSGSIGIPVPSTDVRLVDESGHDVPLGVAGELLIKGPQLFSGYWNQEAETRKAFLDGGWFRTGDIVVMDELGFMTMVDRKKDMILVSGFNVYPNEIEAVVAMMTDVLEAACIGVPDDRSGEAPHLFIVPRNMTLTPEQVEAHCRSHLAAYKVPRHITLIDALPKSTVGKILRKDLRSRLAAEQSNA
ncbi:Long-chain-fatty-acid--CoA ligase [Cupriavidus yeoncheonensis]|uniref:Long-chain-fatty-acid--CoA ligase n=1 Tax=Cupriavidus yeoncheonensis TaxID=1462994 RepID=A0A916MY39_9BURK|nr:AMP-binding protein [Cupriavidus yeoncheonensis]CAG2156631.1 Long-chain-fatty-acid--CoA ligase [Cupriavidus yeoncheonensis]